MKKKIGFAVDEIQCTESYLSKWSRFHKMENNFANIWTQKLMWSSIHWIMYNIIYPFQLSNDRLQILLFIHCWILPAFQFRFYQHIYFNRIHSISIQWIIIVNKRILLLSFEMSQSPNQLAKPYFVVLLLKQNSKYIRMND